MNYHFGVTPALSTERPTREDLINNDEMEAFFYFSGAIYETQAGEQKRVAVIEKLRSIASEWAMEIGQSKAVQDEFLVNGGGIQLRIFGSTRLGVHNMDSDIDILCLAPSFVTRGDFFTSFQETLRVRKDVESILSVPEAYTPVLKFIIDGQAIDMVFASLQLPCLANTLDILDVRCLKGLDEASVRSINGSRVAEWICRLVPNMETFCSTLRAIKYWARVRGLYSNMLGFLGGINFAILVAYVCQAFIGACPYTLVRKFFEMYSIWKWPNPVMLRAMEDLQLGDTDGRYMPVWNAQTNYKDALHIMPIITPAYPAMNSSYNVSPPQFRAFQDEILRGCAMFQQHHRKDGTLAGTNAPHVAFPWATLLESFSADYIKRHPYFVQIDICAQTADEHRSWFGWVESRMRMLIVSLEQPPVVFCHPVANCFHRCRPDPPAETPGGSRVEADPEPEVATTGPHGTGNAVSENGEGAKKSEQADKQSKSKSTEGENKASNGVHVKESTSETAGEENSTDKSSQPPVTEDSSNSNTVAAPILSLADPATVESAKSSNGEEGAPGEHAYVSTFIMGLSFQKGSRFIDIEPPIKEFDYKVRIWSGKKDSMDLKISMFDTNSAPAWVTQTKAEPSSVSSCTPSSKRSRAPPRVELAAEAPGLSTRLFPTSAVKAPLARDRSDTTLTQDMSHSSISSNLFSNGSAGQGKSPRTKTDGREACVSKQNAASRQSPRSPRSAVSSPRQPIGGPVTARQSPAQTAPNGVVPRYVAPTGVVSPSLVVPARSSTNATPGVPLSYRNVANGAATNGNGFVSPAPQHLSMAYAYHAAPGMLPVYVSPGQMGEGPGPVQQGMYPTEIGMHEYPVLAGVAPLQQGAGLRPMPFPPMPSTQSPRHQQGHAVPPMHGAGHSPPKRVRKDASSSSTANNGSGSGSSSSSLDGASQNGQRRKK